MRHRVVYSDSPNPRFMKKKPPNYTALFLITHMWLTDKDIQKLIKMFSVCLSYLLGYQCANKPNSNV